MCRKPFYVAEASIVGTKNFIHISLVKPKGYTWKSGQYAFINIPDLNPIQWHPFSIASSPNGKYLSFMIKRNGDWSGKLIDKFYGIKAQEYDEQVGKLVDFQYQEDLRSYLMEMSIDPNEETVKRNTKLYPKVFISKAISAPAETAVNRRRLILIGAGSGIAPFLAMLDDQQHAAQGRISRRDGVSEDFVEEFKYTEKAHLVFISRDADQFSWLSPYIDKIMASRSFNRKLVLHLYLTRVKYTSIPTFLFWRAFMMRQRVDGARLFASNGRDSDNLPGNGNRGSDQSG